MAVYTVLALCTVSIVWLTCHVIQLWTYSVTQYTIPIIIFAEVGVLMNIEAATNLNVMCNIVPSETVTAKNVYIFLFALYESIYWAAALA